MREGHRQKRSAPFRRLRRSLRRVGRTSHASGRRLMDGHVGAPARAPTTARPHTWHSRSHCPRPARARREDTDGDVDARTADTGGDDHRAGYQEEIHGVDGESAQGVEVLNDGQDALAPGADRPRSPDRARRSASTGRPLRGTSVGGRCRAARHSCDEPERVPARVWK